MTKDPFRRMADIVVKQSNKSASKHATMVKSELGVITANGLLLDTFRQEITSFLVSDHLMADPMNPLVPGDRVLVANINGGNDSVVIARVVQYGG